MPPSLPRVAPALALVVLVGLIGLVKWFGRGPGPLDWRDREGNRPVRVELPRNPRYLGEETEKASGVLPEAFPSPDLQRTEG